MEGGDYTDCSLTLPIGCYTCSSREEIGGGGKRYGTGRGGRTLHEVHKTVLSVLV